MNNQELEEEFKDWKNSFITKKFFEFVLAEAHLHRSRAALGDCKKESFMQSGEDYIKTMVRAEVLELIPEVEYEDLFSEESNETDNTSRTQSSN